MPFSLAGAPGHVDVVVAVNTDPLALGCTPAARGFPYCSASISHPARGYAAALGWIQLVRSTDGASRGASFEMDPFEPLGAASHPFAFFGFLPTLFDAPSRDPIQRHGLDGTQFPLPARRTHPPYSCAPGLLVGISHPRRHDYPAGTGAARSRRLGCTSAHARARVSKLVRRAGVRGRLTHTPPFHATGHCGVLRSRQRRAAAFAAPMSRD